MLNKKASKHFDHVQSGCSDLVMMEHYICPAHLRDVLG